MVSAAILFAERTALPPQMSQDPDELHPDRELIQRFRHVCADGGLKVTHQREQIYLYLATSSSHPTAEDIYNGLKSKLSSLSLDTVYRTVATLEKKRLIQRVQTVNAQARYEARMTEHHHFICDNCEGVTDFDWPSFTRTKLPMEVENMGRINTRTITISGICHDCLGST